MAEQIEKFVDEVMRNPQLIDSIQSNAVGLTELIEFAHSRGYTFTEDEALAYLKSTGFQETVKANIPSAAASSGVAETNSVQSVEAATTEAVEAETTQSAVAETSVFVVAEAVLFAT